MRLKARARPRSPHVDVVTHLPSASLPPNITSRDVLFLWRFVGAGGARSSVSTRVIESKITRSGCFARGVGEIKKKSTVGWDGGVILFIRYRESRVVVGAIFWRAPEFFAGAGGLSKLSYLP